jgi:hypothetical protein
MVNSSVDLNNGIRTQSVITNPTGFDERGTSVTAIAVKEFRSSIIIRDDVNPPIEGSNQLLVQKQTLTASEAWGLGLPNGYTQPPFTDPEGPWKGLIWPYRDQYDYFPGQFDPLGDDVGTPFTDPPDVYGFLGIEAIERGGPTDPVPPPGMGTPDWLNRGITGNGADPQHPATYFGFNISSLSGNPNRFVRMQILAASAVVVTRNSQGVYGELEVPVPDFTIFIQLPEPATALAAASVLSLLTLRVRPREFGRR